MVVISCVAFLLCHGGGVSPTGAELEHLSPYGARQPVVITTSSTNLGTDIPSGVKHLIFGSEPPEGFQFLEAAAASPTPGKVGLFMAKDARIEISKRVIQNTGEGIATFSLAKSPTREARTYDLAPGRRVDYNEWRRAAMQRTLRPEWPPKNPDLPNVPKGTLVIVGGGGTTREIAKAFIEAGGGENGKFVMLPISMPDPISVLSEEETMHRMGAKNVTVIPYREKEQLEDPKVIDALKNATGVWFGGGRQWNFVDAYEGTRLPGLFRDVLNRGGVLGGSSAGATILGDYMSRGAPAGPALMSCEGYERALGFLPGTVIDQHFSARNRFKDMTGLMARYPQFLGIGIDESTAMVVRGSTAEILGRGKVHFYDSRKVRIPEAPDYDAYPSGSKFDLVNRKVLAGK